MKSLMIIFSLLIALMATVGLAQEESTDTETQTETPVYALQVVVDSALIRAFPTEDSEFIGSTFEGDTLIAVGRNADGSWFQVRRPYRDNPSGWIFKRLVLFSFDMGALPITDFETGVTGTTPVLDSGVAAYILTEATLRSAPDLDAEPVAIVPVLLTLPVIERTPDNVWLRVNYNGQSGWVAEFLTRIVGDVQTVPVAPEYALAVIDLPIIPVEVQLAQVNRLRDYIAPNYALAQDLANFWSLVSMGEVVPCAPPPGNIALYDWTPEDVVELPELRRYVRRLDSATLDLNESIAIMGPCGVFTEDQISSAYANAVNASVLYRAILNNLDFLEAEVIR